MTTEQDVDKRLAAESDAREGMQTTLETIRSYAKAEMRDDDRVMFFARMLARMVGTYPNLRLPFAIAVMVANLAWYLFVIGACTVFFVLVFDRREPVRIVKREVVTPEVRAGEQLLIRTIRYRLRECELQPVAYLVDGIGRKFDYISRPGVQAGAADANKPIDTTDGPWIPREAAPGPAEYISIFHYDCNPLQRATNWSIPVFTQPIRFIIKPPLPRTEGGNNGPTDYFMPPGRLPRFQTPMMPVPGAGEPFGEETKGPPASPTSMPAPERP